MKKSNFNKGYKEIYSLRFINQLRKTLFIVDNFYKRPDEIREFALSRIFNSPSYVTGFPGIETGNMKDEDLRPIMDVFSSIVGTQIAWTQDGPQGVFRCQTEQLMKTRTNIIHTDPCRWSGIVYLNPKPKVMSGFSVFQHKESSLERLHPEYSPQVQEAMKKYNKNYRELIEFYIDEGVDFEKWNETEFITNKYNRLVIFDGAMFHGIKELFGNDLETGRLTQNFFFDEVKGVDKDNKPIVSSN